MIEKIRKVVLNVDKFISNITQAYSSHLRKVVHRFTFSGYNQGFQNCFSYKEFYWVDLKISLFSRIYNLPLIILVKPQRNRIVHTI